MWLQLHVLLSLPFIDLDDYQPAEFFLCPPTVRGCAASIAGCFCLMAPSAAVHSTFTCLGCCAQLHDDGHGCRPLRVPSGLGITRPYLPTSQPCTIKSVTRHPRLAQVLQNYVTSSLPEGTCLNAVCRDHIVSTPRGDNKMTVEHKLLPRGFPRSLSLSLETSVYCVIWLRSVFVSTSVLYD